LKGFKGKEAAMQNYGYMDREELTSYDRYVLSKKENGAQKPSNNMDNFCNEQYYNQDGYNEQCYNDNFYQQEEYQPIKKAKSPKKIKEQNKTENAYDEYLFNELSRTEPTGNRVMTSEEFYSTNYSNRQKSTNSTKNAINNLKFKKGGKIILAFYVIIMVALASILIVANTTDIAANENANATINSVEAPTSIVSSMTISEEESEGNNWFDRMCDAMNN
jgi:uncharacterized short protein YbdD (DUF466 family)